MGGMGGVFQQGGTGVLTKKKTSLLFLVEEEMEDTGTNKKRSLEELEGDLTTCKQEYKRLKKLVETHPDTLRQRLPPLLVRELVDTGRLTEYTVWVKKGVDFREVKHHWGAYYPMDRLTCETTLDGWSATYCAIYWHGEDPTWEAEDGGDDDFWIPPPAVKKQGKALWALLLEKNKGDVAKSLASLSVLQCQEHENWFIYPVYM